ncbi:MAG TPA: trehalose-phosphatase, partial [Acidimicrobiales bacterium]
RLGTRYAVVAVVSGRPAAFLRQQLAGANVAMSGLYGLERALGEGPVHVHPDAARWRDVVERAAVAASGAAPARVTVERKGLSVALHWRVAPEAEVWALEFAADAARRSGLVAHPSRMAVELRPPLDADKGSAVAGLVGGVAAAAFLGDDVGDLPAFAAVSRPGLYPARIAVRSPETPPALIAAADAVVSGPQAALEVLAWLAGPD